MASGFVILDCDMDNSIIFSRSKPKEDLSTLIHNSCEIFAFGPRLRDRSSSSEIAVSRFSIDRPRRADLAAAETISLSLLSNYSTYIISWLRARMYNVTLTSFVPLSDVPAIHKFYTLLLFHVAHAQSASRFLSRFWLFNNFNLI